MIYILGYDDNPDGEAYLTEQTSSDYEEDLVYDCAEMLKTHDHVLIISSNTIKGNNLHIQKFTTMKPYSLELIAGAKVNVNKL